MNRAKKRLAGHESGALKAPVCEQFDAVQLCRDIDLAAWVTPAARAHAKEAS